MNVRYLKPRTANRSSRVELFMRLWDTPLTAAQQEKLKEVAPVSQKRSEFGNLNVEGTPFPSDSCLLSRFHPDFESVIEPGVKDFLAAIALDHDLVTYTSCEGHLNTDGVTPHEERHVGVIPRSPEERGRIIALFEDVGRELNGRFPESALEVALMDHTVKDGEKSYTAIDLYLSLRVGHAVSEYFAELETMSTRLVSALLARVDPRTEA